MQSWLPRCRIFSRIWRKSRCFSIASTGTQFTCFTSTKVQILTQLARDRTHFLISSPSHGGAPPTLGTQFTCFTGTKVQIADAEGAPPSVDLAAMVEVVLLAMVWALGVYLLVNMLVNRRLATEEDVCETEASFPLGSVMSGSPLCCAAVAGKSTSSLIPHILVA